MKNINLLLIALILLASCGGLKEVGKVMRNEKIKTTDEFLVKKKDPLILPPNFEDIPEPDSTVRKEDSEDEKIKKILKAPKSINTSSNKSSSVEESILNQIRK